MRNRASAVIIENNRVALIKRIREGQEYYVFPGGGIEKEESPEQAAVRETYEELGLHVAASKLLWKVEHNGTQYFFSADTTGGVFGTGQGEEFATGCGTRGIYKPMWIELEQLSLLEVYPVEISEKVQELIKERKKER